MPFRILFRIFFLVLWSGSAFAAIDSFEFSDDEEQARYQQFIDEMRCPKCDNQNLSGSNSAIAADLRKQIYDMVRSDKTDEEIVSYMVERYGDFILYKPRFTRSTVFLWGAPILFLLIGLLIIFFLLKSRRRTAVSEHLSSSERVELQHILNQYAEKSINQNNTEVK
jgi:cytochrome c-type biogenesis protein CcmH